MDKNFRLSKEEIKPIAVGYGACIATDMITVEGRKVGYMYREEPFTEIDNGWRFMSGDETQDYMDDADKHAFYDTNTIANYDPDITSFIELPIGTLCERNENGILVEVGE